MKRFGYLEDRLCGLSLAAYAINHLLIVPHLGRTLQSHAPWAWPFLHSHFDDLLLMPAALPVVLWLQRHLEVRKQDGPPSWGEMWGHLLVWSAMCKIVGPLALHIGVADPWDVLCFAAGGMGAMLWWRRQGRTGFQPVDRARLREKLGTTEDHFSEETKNALAGRTVSLSHAHEL